MTPAFKTPVTVTQEIESNQNVAVVRDASARFLCMSGSLVYANAIRDILNDSARLRAELDEVVGALRPFAANPNYQLSRDEYRQAARLVARHEGRKG